MTDCNGLSASCNSRRGSQQPSVEEAFLAVDRAASALCAAVKEDYPLECGVTFDVFNNLLTIKKLPEKKVEPTSTTEAVSNTDKYIAVRDRFGKVIPRRWTTHRVSEAREIYLESTHEAIGVVSATLNELSEDLSRKLIPIVQATHWTLILQVMCILNHMLAMS